MQHDILEFPSVLHFDLEFVGHTLKDYSPEFLNIIIDYKFSFLEPNYLKKTPHMTYIGVLE